MSAADEAYKAAEEEIARVKAAGETFLSFRDNAFRALEVLPPEIAGLTGLMGLFLNQAQVSDLTPLRNLSALWVLNLNQTQVSDLRPLLSLAKLRRGAEARKTFAGLYFNDCPALRNNPALQELYELEDRHDRTLKVLDYLATLPTWPEPLPKLAQSGESNAPPLKVQTAQTISPFCWTMPLQPRRRRSCWPGRSCMHCEMFPRRTATSCRLFCRVWKMWRQS